VVLAVIVAASLAARLALLVARPLWHDELFTVWAARLPTPQLIDALRVDSGPPLFYALERPFARADATPRQDPLVRLLPFAAALGLIACAAALPRGPSRRWGIALASGFALVNLYAAEARAYAPLALALFGVFLFGLVSAETLPRVAALFACAAIALWLHYLALFGVGAALLLALLSRRWKSALALALAAAAFSPWLPVLAGQPRDAMAWLHEPFGSVVTGFLSALGGVGRIPAPFTEAPPLFEIPGAVVGVILAASLVPSARADRRVRAALAFVVLVLAAALAASLARPVAFAGRSEMAVLPVWIWAVALAAPERKTVARTASVAVALGLAATILAAASPHRRSTAAAAVERVSRLARPGDVVLAGPGFSLPALLAADRGRLAARVEALPSGDAAHPGWFVAWPLKAEDVRDAEAASAAVGAGRQLFLLLPPAYNLPALMDPLGRRGTLRELVRQNDGVLTTWTPGEPSSR
jgi:hypothetical protein